METGKWRQTSDSSWRIDDSLEPALAVYEDREYSDVTLEMDLTLEHGDEASLVLNYTSEGYYFMGIGGLYQRYVIGRHDIQSNRDRKLAGYGLAQDIEPGVTFRVRVSISFQPVGALLTLTVDGVPVLLHTDYDPLSPGGVVGLRSVHSVASYSLVWGPE